MDQSRSQTTFRAHDETKSWSQWRLGRRCVRQRYLDPEGATNWSSPGFCDATEGPRCGAGTAPPMRDYERAEVCAAIPGQQRNSISSTSLIGRLSAAGPATVVDARSDNTIVGARHRAASPGSFHGSAGSSLIENRSPSSPSSSAACFTIASPNTTRPTAWPPSSRLLRS